MACAVLPFFGWAELPRLGSLDAVAASYGLAIVSFVSGTHWGIAIRDAKDIPVNLFITSNVALLAAWFAFIGAGVTWQLLMQIAVFVFLWVIDRRLQRAGVISAEYFRLRSIATLIVCTSLVITVLQ